MEAFKNYIVKITRELSAITQSIRQLAEKEPSEIKVVIDMDKISKEHQLEKYKDFFTPEDQEKMAEKVFKKVPKVDEKKVVTRVLSAIKEFTLSLTKRQEKFENHVLSQVGDPGMAEFEVKRLIARSIPKKKDIQQIIIKQAAKSLESDLEDLTIIEKIARGLEKLKGKKRLSAKAIRDLGLFASFGGGTTVINTGGSGVGTNVQVVDISTQFNGVLKTFTVPAASAILMVIITGSFPNGVLRPTVDFTIPNSTSITFTSEIPAPPAGTNGVVLYVQA